VRAVRIDAFGGPEVLRVVEDAQEPDGDVVVEVAAAGVNFGDVLVRRGDYFGGAELPVWPGWEVVGRVRGSGERVVALLDGGGYAERVAVPVAACWPVPDDVPDAVALAFVLQGTTAWHLLRSRLRTGDAVLVTGAGSAVTRLVVQLARAWGAGRIVVVASSPEKAAAVRAAGADETVAEVPRGRAFDLVVDMLGGAVLDAALRALRPGGRAVLYGAAAGATNKLDTGALLRHGLTVSGFWLGHVQREHDLGTAIAGLVARWREGKVAPLLGPELPLDQAPEAHRVVEARAGAGAGKVVLRP